MQPKLVKNRPIGEDAHRQRYVPPIPVPDPPKLHNSWLPVAITLLTYYPEMLQYEITDKTTVAPPFSAGPLDVATSPHPTYTTAAQTNPVSWWITSSTTPRPTTQKPTQPPPQDVQTTTRRTTQTWWSQPTTKRTTTWRPTSEQDYYTKPTVSTTKRTTWPSGPTTWWTEKSTSKQTTKRTTYWGGPS